MIEFLGRNDNQVKVRGFRIELGEIEAALVRHPNVQAAAVLARADGPGEKRLVAYLVTSNELQVTSSQDALLVTRHSSLVTQLRDFLQERLPGYMVPAIFVPMEALPLTPNGKVDRRALPAPETDRPELEVAFVAPRTDLERVLAQIWAEVLGLEQVGIYDSFFDLGGHSLLATQVISRVDGILQIELPVSELFAAPTVAGLAERIETMLWAVQVQEEAAQVHTGVRQAGRL